MEYILKSGNKLVCTPEELRELIELGVIDSPSNSALSNHEQEGQKNYKNIEGNRLRIDPDLFFVGISRLMARVMLSFLKHEGLVSQTQLTTDTSTTGKALRRPNGALHKRVRSASNERIKTFCTVKEAESGIPNSDRIFSIHPEVLEFLRTHKERIDPS